MLKVWEKVAYFPVSPSSPTLIPFLSLSPITQVGEMLVGCFFGVQLGVVAVRERGSENERELTDK